VYNDNPVTGALFVAPEAGGPSRSAYLPETSGEVYNDNPVTGALFVAPEAGGPSRSAYLPETSGEVYNDNPVTVMPGAVEFVTPVVPTFADRDGPIPIGR
jgi:hypothetical protein